MHVLVIGKLEVELSLLMFAIPWIWLSYLKQQLITWVIIWELCTSINYQRSDCKHY